MTREEVKELALLTGEEYEAINRKWNETGNGKGGFPEGEYWQIVLKAQVDKLLNFRDICPECEGSGKKVDFTTTTDAMLHIGSEIECPTCKGTGGEKLLYTKEDCDKCHEIRSVKV